jgi:hypothetical protein
VALISVAMLVAPVAAQEVLLQPEAAFKGKIGCNVKESIPDFPNSARWTWRK